MNIYYHWYQRIILISVPQKITFFQLIYTFFPGRRASTTKLIKDKRSNSCFSETSETSVKSGSGAEGGRRPSRAFLIKQRDSGEETLVTLTPVGGRQNVPTIVGPQFSKGKVTSKFIKFDLRNV